MRVDFFSRAGLILAVLAFAPASIITGQKFDTENFMEMKARSIGPAGMSGRVTAVEAVVSNPSIIYIGTASGGVWKSTSGGTSWKPVFDKEKILNIGAVAITQSNPDVVWAGTGEGNPRNSMNVGAGIYKSLDAGETWSFMGLEKTKSIHRIIVDPRDENTVYVGAHGDSWEENPERGVYKTTDGGRKWSMVSDKDDIGNRPFYFYDIYVDPVNENRLYTIYSEVGLSEDGGKSFRTIAGNIHSDHHAWWINPKDPSFILEGNDGGMAISRDRGVTWQFMENLPLGQWYHVRVDNDVPYNVYGGLQDNGSWRGPAFVWRSGGIRNEYWQEVMFGDGFDVLPDPDDSRYGYAMSQSGNVGRYDYETGYTYSVKPTAPDLDTELRFHWNAAIEQDPFDNSTIYFGSQFLHKSMDKGLTWAIISPDLTTNDPAKQIYNKSGGLTLDVTGAETYTTIITIAVSPVQKGVIWVGTDDGNIQLTRDGGKNWQNFAGKLAGLPANSWVPQIEPSHYKAGEAWVVANNYRMGDFSAYAYRTKDFGATWERIVDGSDVNGYALCIVQDPVEPNLVFLGTEQGLWLSIDNAGNWTQWKHGIPSVSTMALAIQEREADLVIATFGRSVFILDDIRPLRAIAASGGKILDEKFTVFEAPAAYMIRSRQQPAGNHFPGNATYQGKNRSYGSAVLSYYLNEEKGKIRNSALEEKPARGNKGNQAMNTNSKPGPREGKPEVKYDSIRIQIFQGDEVIRNLTYEAKPGFNQVTWRLHKKGVDYPNPWARRYGRRGFGNRQSEPAGFMVLPGEYKAVLSCGDRKDSTLVKVEYDPRMELDPAGYNASEEMYNELSKKAEALNLATTRLTESKEVLTKVSSQTRRSGDQDLKDLAKETRAVQDSLNVIWEYIMGKEETGQGLSDRTEPTVVSRLYSASRYIQSRPDGPTATEERLVEQASEVIEKTIEMTNAFYRDVWSGYREKVEKTDFKWFRDYEPIEL